MSQKRAASLVWIVCGLLSVGILLHWAIDIGTPLLAAPNPIRIVEGVNSLLWLGFPLLAGLILARRPRNIIGWLLLLPAFAQATYPLSNRFLASFAEAPVATLPLLLLLWYSNWSWLLLVLPVVLTPLFFPSGRPPGPRWRWLVAATAVQVAVFIFLATFAARLSPIGLDDVTWSVSNPIGFLSDDLLNSIVGIWLICLGLLTLLCLASLLVRYRRASVVERTQIRWLLYACGLFALVYVPGLVFPFMAAQGTLAAKVLNLSFGLAIVAIYAAIAIAILRYRLYDIDLIIRRTLTYSVLTAVLALIYFGCVALLQSLVTAVSDEPSAVATVASTLAIAALFSPLRRRVQNFIDRRFFRQKYDSAQTLTAFGAAARDETDLDHLSGRLVDVVHNTMQPASLSLWLLTTRAANAQVNSLRPQMAPTKHS